MKISFKPVNSTPIGRIEENQRVNRSLGLPRVGECGPAMSRLAVVGGSPDIADHIETLRSWDGEVWAINGTYDWCRENGIDATFYAIDPSPVISKFSKHVERAVIADTIDASVMKNLEGKQIEIAFLGELGLPFGTTAACTSVTIAAERGHTSVTLFGCASSRLEGVTHAYRDEGNCKGVMIVACGGNEFHSSPGMIMQAEELAEIATSMPGFVKVVGSGFLPALIEHGDYDIVSVDGQTWKSLCEQNKHLREA